MDDVKSRVRDFIKENNMINKADTIVIGLSGGADSVCLFDVLSALREEIGFRLVAVHVNHQIRGEQADRDEVFVKALCEGRQVECYSFKKDIPAIAHETKETEEECGRRIRYEAFREVGKKFDSYKIAVAHHMNDQAETILFRMARGTGVRGISGMKPVHEDIIRPLLCVKKDEIEKYIKEESLANCEDYTNDDINYSRNYIRNQIIPRLNRINSDAVGHICEMAVMASKMQEYVENNARQVLLRARMHGDKVKYNTDIINKEDTFLQPYIIRGIFDENHISLKDVTKDHIENICKMLTKTESTSIDLPRGIKIVKEANSIFIETGNLKGDVIESVKCQYIKEGINILSDGSKLECRILREYDKDFIPRNPYTKWFDYDKIFNSLCVRSRQSGDRIVIDKEGSAKKLKEYFINEKIPKSERDKIKLLAVDSKIVWVIGYRIADDCKVTDNTKTVVEISYIREA